MNLVSFQILGQKEITPLSRCVIKKGQLYIEQSKPNLFVCIWRHLRSQYDKCKIARLAMGLFGEKNEKLFQLAREGSSEQGYKAIENVRVLVNAIPLKNKKNRQRHQELTQQLAAIEKTFKEIHQQASLQAQQGSPFAEIGQALYGFAAKTGEALQNGLATAKNYCVDAVTGKLMLAGVEQVAGKTGTIGLVHLHQAVNNPDDKSVSERLQHGAVGVAGLALEGLGRMASPLIGEQRQTERAARLFYGNS